MCFAILTKDMFLSCLKTRYQKMLNKVTSYHLPFASNVTNGYKRNQDTIRQGYLLRCLHKWSTPRMECQSYPPPSLHMSSNRTNQIPNWAMDSITMSNSTVSRLLWLWWYRYDNGTSYIYPSSTFPKWNPNLLWGSCTGWRPVAFSWHISGWILWFMGDITNH